MIPVELDEENQPKPTKTHIFESYCLGWSYHLWRETLYSNKNKFGCRNDLMNPAKRGNISEIMTILTDKKSYVHGTCNLQHSKWSSAFPSTGKAICLTKLKSFRWTSVLRVRRSSLPPLLELSAHLGRQWKNSGRPQVVNQVFSAQLQLEKIRNRWVLVRLVSPPQGSNPPKELPFTIYMGDRPSHDFTPKFRFQKSRPPLAVVEANQLPQVISE